MEKINIPSIKDINEVIEALDNENLMEIVSKLRDVSGAVSTMILIVNSDNKFEEEGTLSQEATEKIVNILKKIRKNKTDS